MAREERVSTDRHRPFDEREYADHIHVGNASRRGEPQRRQGVGLQARIQRSTHARHARVAAVEVGADFRLLTSDLCRGHYFALAFLYTDRCVFVSALVVKSLGRSLPGSAQQTFSSSPLTS